MISNQNMHFSSLLILIHAFCSLVCPAVSHLPQYPSCNVLASALPVTCISRLCLSQEQPERDVVATLERDSERRPAAERGLARAAHVRVPGAVRDRARGLVMAVDGAVLYRRSCELVVRRADTR